MALVIGVFQPADDRGAGPDTLGQFPLGKAGRRPQDGTVDLLRWHDPFLDDAMREDNGCVAVEEIEYSVVNTTETGPELVNVVP